MMFAIELLTNDTKCWFMIVSRKKVLKRWTTSLHISTAFWPCLGIPVTLNPNKQLTSHLSAKKSILFAAYNTIHTIRLNTYKTTHATLSCIIIKQRLYYDAYKMRCGKVRHVYAGFLLFIWCALKRRWLFGKKFLETYANWANNQLWLCYHRLSSNLTELLIPFVLDHFISFMWVCVTKCYFVFSQFWIVVLWKFYVYMSWNWYRMKYYKKCVFFVLSVIFHRHTRTIT